MHRCRWQFFFLPVSSVLFVLPALLSAQSPDGRRQLSALRDSVFQIAAADDASTLARAEQASLGRDKSDALLLMQAGLAQLRLGQLSTDRAPLDRAQALFDEAIYRAPDGWPWPWYGLALADLALDSTGVVVKPSMHSDAGMYYRRAGIRALTRSLEADSSFAPAAALLAQLIIPQSDADFDEPVREAIRRAAAQPGATGAQLAFGRMQRNLGHPDSALQAFRLYVVDGGDLAVGLLESARMLNALDSLTPAAMAYFVGAASASDSSGRDAYRKDVAWVASNDELLAFDSLTADSIRPWLERFWAKRDARELRAPGERLAEHFRRWRYVYSNFQIVGRRDGVHFGVQEPDALTMAARSPDLPDFIRFNGAGVFAATDHGNRSVDDRGIIYMRHGAPDKVAMYRSFLAWRYQTTSGPLVFQFGPSSSLGTQAPTTLIDQFPMSDDLFDVMMSVDGTYALVAGQLREQADKLKWEKLAQQMGASGHGFTVAVSSSQNIVSRPLLQHLERKRMEDLRVGLSTDGYPPHFSHPLTPHAQFYAVGEPGQVLAVFALEGSQLEADSLPGNGAGYPVTIRLIATNANGRVVRIDTTRRFRTAEPLGKGQYLLGLETLRLTPGTWDIRLLTSQHGTSAGGAIGRIGLTVPGANALALSDLVLGRAGSGLTWHDGDAGSVPLNPLDVYPGQGSAELYYELHGARAGTAYRTDIEVKGVYGDAKGSVHLSFEETARNTFVRARRSIGLDKLEPGQYRVTVEVTENGSGRTAAQSRLLNVSR